MCNTAFYRHEYSVKAQGGSRHYTKPSCRAAMRAAGLKPAPSEAVPRLVEEILGEAQPC